MCPALQLELAMPELALLLRISFNSLRTYAEPLPEEKSSYRYLGAEGGRRHAGVATAVLLQPWS